MRFFRVLSFWGAAVLYLFWSLTSPSLAMDVPEIRPSDYTNAKILSSLLLGWTFDFGYMTEKLSLKSRLLGKLLVNKELFNFNCRTEQKVNILPSSIPLVATTTTDGIIINGIKIKNESRTYFIAYRKATFEEIANVCKLTPNLNYVNCKINEAIIEKSSSLVKDSSNNAVFRIDKDTWLKLAEQAEIDVLPMLFICKNNSCADRSVMQHDEYQNFVVAVGEADDSVNSQIKIADHQNDNTEIQKSAVHNLNGKVNTTNTPVEIKRKKPTPEDSVVAASFMAETLRRLYLCCEEQSPHEKNCREDLSETTALSSEKKIILEKPADATK
jgi:hypothetical protein